MKKIPLVQSLQVRGERTQVEHLWLRSQPYPEILGSFGNALTCSNTVAY
jgi:hypothetical protein